MIGQTESILCMPDFYFMKNNKLSVFNHFWDPNGNEIRLSSKLILLIILIRRPCKKRLFGYFFLKKKVAFHYILHVNLN